MQEQPNSITSEPVVWCYNLYRSFIIHTFVEHERNAQTMGGMIKSFEKQVINEKTIHGVDYGHFGEEERHSVAVLFTMPSLTWAKISTDKNCGFLSSTAYVKGFCNGGYSSLRDAFENAKKSFNDRLDKYGTMNRGAVQINKSDLDVEKLLTTETDYDDDRDGVIFRESILQARTYDGQNLKDFVQNVRLENLNKGHPYEFEFYPIYSFGNESKKDLEHKHRLCEVR